MHKLDIHPRTIEVVTRRTGKRHPFDVIDPATERTIASVASASVDDAKAALDAAQAA